jgi:hypothetical protein
LFTAAALTYDVSTAWAISVFLILSVGAMQVYHRLSQRAAALDRLYAVAREMGPIASEAADLAPALTQLRRIMRANELELSVTTSADRSFATVVTVYDDENAGGEGVSVMKRAVDDEMEASLNPRFKARKPTGFPRGFRRETELSASCRRSAGLTRRPHSSVRTCTCW